MTMHGRRSGRLRESLHHLGQALTPLLGGLVVMIDANHSELVCKLAGLHQMVECRHNQTLGQVPPSAEDDQGCGRRLTGWEELCHRSLRIQARWLSPCSSRDPILGQLSRAPNGLRLAHRLMLAPHALVNQIPNPTWFRH